jgi:hypothetical protein
MKDFYAFLWSFRVNGTGIGVPDSLESGNALPNMYVPAYDQ